MKLIISKRCFELLMAVCVLMNFVSPVMSKEIAKNVKECLMSIENKMSGVKTVQTKFIQTKKLALFNQQIVIEGSLSLKKPSMFAWHIDSPLRQAIILKDKIIKQWDEDTNKIQTIYLSKDSSFSIATEQMNVWVSGAYLSLIDEYDIEIIQVDPMQIKFTPFKTTMTYSIIDNITVLFQKDEKYIEEIIIKERDGDAMSLTFFDTVINIDLDPSVWKVNSHDR